MRYNILLPLLLAAAVDDSEPRPEPVLDDFSLLRLHRKDVVINDIARAANSRSILTQRGLEQQGASKIPLEWRVPCRRPDCAAPIGSPCKKSTLGRKFVHGCRAEDAKKLAEV